MYVTVGSDEPKHQSVLPRDIGIELSKRYTTVYYCPPTGGGVCLHYTGIAFSTTRGLHRKKQNHALWQFHDG